MVGKVQEYVRLADETSRKITSNADQWTSFLTVAAQLYKYSYQDQLMIYAQRPSATACASYELWNDTMHRYIRRGSKGIALLRDTPGGMQVSYVFDIADTGTRENSLEVNHWALNTEIEPMVRRALANVYSIYSAPSLYAQLAQLSEQQALAYWETYRQEIIDSVDGSEIKSYDENAIGSSFRKAAATGVFYTVSSRCNLENELTPWEFSDVQAWNTLSASAALGQAISRISGRVLREIERAVKAYERSVENDRTKVQTSERLPDTGDGSDRGRTETSGQVRIDEEKLSEGASASTVQQAAPERHSDDTLAGDRDDSESADGYADAAADTGEPSDGEPESREPDEMGSSDEQPAPPSRGNDSIGDDLRLTDYTPQTEQLSFFLPTEEEQIALIEQAEDVRYTPFAFSMSVPQEDIDHILRLDGNARNARMMIATEFSKGKTNEEIAAFLQKTFHGGNGVVIDDRRYAVWYGSDGIRIATGDAAQHLASAKVISYLEAAERIGQLLEQGEYATNVELAEAPGYERQQLAQSLWYLKQDLSDEARDAGFLSAMDSLRGGGFPDETVRLAEALTDPDWRDQLLNEYRAFLSAHNENPSLLRFRYHKPNDLMAGLAELSFPRREYSSDMAEIPAIKRFITEDEIAACLSRGSGVEGGKGHIYAYFSEKHSSKEQIDFLKAEYGIGGHAPAVSGEWHSSEDHSSKGISLKKRDCPEVQIAWANVAKRISELNRKDRFLTPEEKMQYEQLQRRGVERNTGRSEYNAVKEAHPDDIVLYQVGDFFEMYGDDARTAAELLNIRLNTRSIPDAGRVDMCGIPAHSSEQYVEKLRDRFDVTISAVNADTHERNTYTLLSVDHEADKALNAYEAEFGADGTRAFGGTEVKQEESLPEEYSAPRYLVIAYHPTENGFDEKLDYQTLPEAERAAQGYVDGTMENDGFRYDGAAVYDLQSKTHVRIFGDYPDMQAQAQVRAAASKSEQLYAIGDRFAYQNAGGSEMLLTAIEQDSIHYVLSDMLHQPSVQMARDEFDRNLSRGVITPSLSQNEQAQLLEQAIISINGYCLDEFGENADFSDLKKIALAYTTVTDSYLPIQVDVNLVDFAVEITLNGEHYETRQYSSLQALIDNELNNLDFNDLVAVNEEDVLLYDHNEPANNLAQEAADYEAERMAYREQVMTTLTPEQQRIVEAMEVGGFPFRPTERDPIYFGDVSDYPTVFTSWDEAYDFVNDVELKDTPGLRDKVQAVLHPEPTFPYAVGDTVYLEDNKPFVIDSIGRFDISLRDLTLLYPIFRAESRESFARLMERFPQPQKEAAEPVNYHTETVAVYPAEQNNLPYDVVIETLHIDEPTPPTLGEAADGTPISVQISGEWQTFPNKEAAETAMFEEYKDKVRRSAENFHITDDDLGVGGAKAKFRMNMDAINLLKQLEYDGMQATPEQQEVLSRYVGWGGLADAFDESKSSWKDEFADLYATLTPEEYAAARASTLNAHYTSPTVIRAIYDAIENMGFQTGNILEPSMGVGNFFGMLPDSMASSKLYGVELDSLTGRIAKQLYPKADITVAGFETTDRKDFFDLAVGNVPFGQYQVRDRAYDKLGFSIHNYFFAKALDQVRPGGVVAFVTSRFTLDAKDSTARKYIAQRADFLGAIRLPNNAFRANAGTDVVSDIIFLQKRDRPIDIEPEWVHLGENADGFAINSYFVEHPDMILGRQTSESTQYGRQDFTVVPYENLDLADQLQEAIQNIRGTYTEAELPDLGEDEKLVESIPADPTVKNFSYTVVNGEVYYRQNSVMVKPSLSATASERVKGLVALRKCVDTIIQAQLDRVDDENLSILQSELNTQYDNFTSRYGLINTRGNALAFSDDPSYYLLCSLEVLTERGELARKADIFTKRTIRQQLVITHVDTAAEALAVSIAEKACVNIPFMSDLTGKDEETLTSELRGVIFKDHNRSADDSYTWRTADEFLSGNVREKLSYYTRMLETIEEGTDKYAQVLDNVEALRAAQPKDLDASEIDVRLGATWVDKPFIEDFMFETFDTPHYLRSYINVQFSTYTAEWNISRKTLISASNVAAHVTYGTNRANAYRILEDTLNLRDVRIYDTVRDADGSEKRVLNQKETTLAQQKQQSIKEAFRDWIWRDPARRETLVKRYNELFNSTRPREYDGQHITFQGMTPTIELREHQRNAVAHILYGGNTLLAHEVGAGKTFEMIAAVMESKRLGLCQKAMFVVPNHLTEQWASEFLRLYPSANILVTTRKDFERANRQKFCARIATGDYDAVIIGHSQFERIPVSKDRQQRLLQEQIDDITEGISGLKKHRGERFTIKQLERTKRQLETRLKKLEAEEKKDQVVTFEQLGVDRLYVDEAHFYKNMFLFTKMRNVAGLSTTEAQKSSDMFMKCRYMDELTGGRGIVFATGTPVSNSMTELYTMQRYLQYDALRQKSMIQFDAWASTFGETTTAIELAPEGTGYRARTRFAKFFNLPELMTMFREIADIKTADQLNLPTPNAHYETVVVKPSEYQQEMVQALSERAAMVHSKEVDPKTDNMLKITSDGRKLGLDQRLINPLLPDDPGSKVNACVGNILRIWREGQSERLTQLVFSDLSTPKGRTSSEKEVSANAEEDAVTDNDETGGAFNIYSDIRSKLIAQGVPQEEIAFIHEANTEARKKELFAKVRAGQVRILLGSTAKMGAGTNVQDRLVASHDLDCPWRPGDLEQRAGRIVRQGNQNSDVFIYRYVTEGTFDAYLWQTVENKQRFISQIMTSKSPVRSCEDVDETALSYAEIKALCAGDPRIREKMDLDVDVARLRLMKADHQSQQYHLEDQVLKVFPQQIEQETQLLHGYERDIKTLKEHPLPSEGFVGMTVANRTVTDKEEAGKAILEACKGASSGKSVLIGSYRGLQMSVQFDSFANKFELSLRGAVSHRMEVGSDPRGNITRLDNLIEQIPKRMEVAQERLEVAKQQLTAAKQEIGKPFPQDAELKAKSARLAELDSALNMGESHVRQAPEKNLPER